MATFDWPELVLPATMEPGLRKAGARFESPLNGTAQAVDFVAERWMWSLTLRRHDIDEAEAGAIEALLNLLAGGVDRVRAWHFARPIPLGTLRGNPVLSQSVARGAQAITVGAAPGTLRAGDMVGLGNHLLMVSRDCFPVGSSLSIPFVNRIREPVAAGTALVWDRPRALFTCQAMRNPVSYRPGSMEPAGLDLVEWF